MTERYRHGFDDDSSYGAALRLVARAGFPSGVVLDVGCGWGAVADPLRDAGFTYVGVDVAEDGLADVRERGHEVHRVDLLDPPERLAAALDAAVGDRSLAAILALDVLEHLLDVPATLAVLAASARPHGAGLVVSYPNVTHADVAAKLVLGRWDTTDEGLLDRTHTQFLAGRDLPRVFAAAGWHQADAEDVVRAVSDQCFPSYAPVLRRGAPAGDLLRAWRGRADPYGETFQFVRRFTIGEPAATVAPVPVVDEDRPLLSVVVLADGAPVGALRAALAAQDPAPAEVLEVDTGVTDGGHRALALALASATGRYVVVLRPSDRVLPGWAPGFAAQDALRPAAVLRAGVRDAEGAPVDTTTLDPLHAAVPGRFVGAAVAVPTEVVQAMGLQPDPALGPAEVAWAVLAAEAALWCGVEPVPQVTVEVDVAELPDVDLVERRALVALDAAPLVLPAGAASRLADLRRRVVAADGRQLAADVEAAARAEQIEVLAAHVHDLGGRLEVAEAERDHWRQVAKRRFSVQLRALVGRLLGRLEG